MELAERIRRSHVRARQKLGYHAMQIEVCRESGVDPGIASFVYHGVLRIREAAVGIIDRTDEASQSDQNFNPDDRA